MAVVWRWGLPHAVSVASGDQQGTKGSVIAGDRAWQGVSQVASLPNKGFWVGLGAVMRRYRVTDSRGGCARPP